MHAARAGESAMRGGCARAAPAPVRPPPRPPQIPPRPRMRRGSAPWRRTAATTRSPRGPLPPPQPRRPPPRWRAPPAPQPARGAAASALRRVPRRRGTRGPAPRRGRGPAAREPQPPHARRRTSSRAATATAISSSLTSGCAAGSTLTSRPLSGGIAAALRALRNLQRRAASWRLGGRRPAWLRWARARRRRGRAARCCWRRCLQRVRAAARHSPAAAPRGHVRPAAHPPRARAPPPRQPLLPCTLPHTPSRRDVAQRHHQPQHRRPGGREEAEGPGVKDRIGAQRAVVSFAHK
jgi:hypothetical protein